MRIFLVKNVKFWHCRRLTSKHCRSFATQGCTNFTQDELTTEIKHDIENHWRDKMKRVNFDVNKLDEKYLVVPMFPYPSGYLHMGHVRVYTISDTVARYQRLNGKNVLHPIGWDAFGLPAENAAIERNILPNEWTKHNIEHMRSQLDRLGCSFEWSREVSTCDPSFFKWTQWIFLQMYKRGLAVQRQAEVNWDPVDQTVLANEQVDSEGRSWRSGAKVERKLLKQWFIRSTKFAKQLYEGLDDPGLRGWNDVREMQRNWIAPPTGYSFNLKLLHVNEADAKDNLQNLTVWTDKPEEMKDPGFIAIKSTHALNNTGVNSGQNNHLLDVTVKNPFNEGSVIPIVVSDDLDYPPFCDTYLGMPSIREVDKQLADKLWVKYNDNKPIEKNRDSIIKKAKSLDIGGYLVSARIQDWLISRQRYWGTPIPIIHCPDCGTIPVPESALPVQLPEIKVDERNRPIPLSKRDDFLKTKCHKCDNENAQRESDTMDTFVDSSWYFLRYLSPKSEDEIFSKKIAKKVMPIDLYIGGLEHAVLHLYVARFMTQFLKQEGWVSVTEPFQHLLVQGMVNGRTFLAQDGRYLREDEVNILNEKQNRAEEIVSGMPVRMSWEKMSKSKKNGVDPFELFDEYSVDTIRLIMLGDVTPRSPRNWSQQTFPGILKWQHRLWLCLSEFNQYRQDDSIEAVDAETDNEFKKEELKIFEARNLRLAQTTDAYGRVFSFSNAIKGCQGLTDALRRAPKNVIKYSAQYERALGNLLIMLSPIAPHFASELWSKFLSVPNRVAVDKIELKWDEDVLEQKWPNVDMHYNLSLRILIDDEEVTLKYPRSVLDNITKDMAMEEAQELDVVKEALSDSRIVFVKWTHAKGQHATLIITTSKAKEKKQKKKKKKSRSQSEDEDAKEM